MSGHTYLIEPRAPLIIRSGRPFDGQAGADEARFPPPSTLAGALRTAHALSTDRPFGPELAQIQVCGPLPYRVETQHLLVPKPADAHYFWNKTKTEVLLVRAQPRSWGSEGEGCDLPPGLLPVQLTEAVQGKSAPGPVWWAFEDLIAWRTKNSQKFTVADIAKRGWTPFSGDTRTHVGIDPETYAGEDGKLFQTTGLPFWKDNPSKDTHVDQLSIEPIGLLGRIDGQISAALITLGGERRLSGIRPAKNSYWPSIQEDLIARIRAAGGLTLTLLTPGLFAKGWMPGSIPGLELVGVACDRWHPHSGWDLANSKPRAGRKLVPAGAVYWYRIRGEVDDKSLIDLWLQPIADHQQDRLDGFGLALPQPYTPADAST